MKKLWSRHNFNSVMAVVITILFLLQSVPVFADTALPGENLAVLESIDFSNYSDIGDVPLLSTSSNNYTQAVIAENSLYVQQLSSQFLNSAGTAENTAAHDVFTKSFEEEYSGKYKLSIDYEVNVESIGQVESNGTNISVSNPYYLMRLLDNLYIRIYNRYISVLNASSSSNSTMSIKNITTNTAANTLNIVYDSYTGQVEVYLNDNTDVVSVGTVNAESLSSFSLRAMQRMTTSTYLKINSYQVELINEYDSYDYENAQTYTGDMFDVTYDETAKSLNVNQTDSTPVKNNACNTTTYTAFNETISIKDGNKTSTNLRGKYQIDLEYDINVDYASSVDGVSITAPYYRMDIEGFGHLRFYNNAISVFNANSSSNNTMSVTKLYTDTQSNNKLRIILDTTTRTFTVYLNTDSNVSTGTAQDDTVYEIRNFDLKGMERMAVGSYFKLTGYNLKCIEKPQNTPTNTNIYQPTDDPVYYYTQPRDENGDYDYFGYYLYGDPNHVSDAEFFGEWNSSKGVWNQAPRLNYSDYEGLADVELAVKAGDYDTAKSELLTYYRSVGSSRIKKVTKPTTNADVLLKSLARNIYPTCTWTGEMIDVFDIETNQGWDTYRINATNTVSTAKGSYDSFSVMISSIDKYYTTAEVYSQESGQYAPKLVVTAEKNGVSRTLEITADKDGMIVAGENAKTVYDDETVMQIQEHGTYQNYDNTTKRAYVAFDISDLSSSDTITDAYIELYARSYIPGNENLAVTIPKEMSCYWYHDSSWTESNLCWNSFSDQLWFSCNDMEAWDYITSYVPTVKGKVCSYHRGLEFIKLSDTYGYYHSKGNDEEAEKYAYTFLRQEMAHINSVGLDTSVMNELDMSKHLENLNDAVLRVADSSYMSPEIFTALMKYQWQLADYLVNIYYGTRSNNWATFGTGSVYSTYARFPEYADHEAWEERTKSENERVCVDNEEYGGSLVYEDGMCVELTHNYVLTLLSSFYAPISIYELTGKGLPYTDNTMNMLERMIEAWALSSGPYFGGFNIGDAYDPYTSFKGTFYNWYKKVFPNNEIIRYVATAGKSGALPENPTTNFPYGLRTYMRSDWGKDSLQMSMTGKMVGSHGHKDALSVTMFAYGKYLLTDPGYGSLLTGTTRNKMISPDYHNLVTVNKGDKYTMENVDSTQLNFKSNDDYDFVEYSSTASTTASLMQRSVTFAKDSKFWIITDYDVPNDTTVSNNFYQHWNLYPKSNPSIDADTKILRTNYTDQANVQVVPIGADSLTAYTEDTLYSEKSGSFINTKQGIYQQSKSGNAIYSTIIIPENVGENIVVSDISKLSTDRTDEIENAFTFTINRDGNEDKYYFYHINDESLKYDKSLGNYSTDASTALIQEASDGTIVSAYLLNATYLNKGEETIFASDTEVEDISITYEGSSLVICSENVDYIDEMPFTVSPENCYSMMFNGTYVKIPATVAKYDYSKYNQLSDITGLSYTPSSASTDTVSIRDGMLMKYQDTTIPLNSSGEKNTAVNALITQGINAVIERNDEYGTYVEADALQGDFDIEINYSANATQYNGSYYILNLGNSSTTSLYGRVYPSKITWLNASSSSASTLSPNTSLADNLDGTQHVIKMNVSTTDGYLSLRVDDGDAVEGEFTGESLGLLTLNSMQRAPIGAWFGISSIKVIQEEPYYSEDALTILDSLPETLSGSVTDGFTVPDIDGVTWSSDNSNVIIDDNGYVTINGGSGNVTVTASFSVTLSDSSTINYKKNYIINIED